MESTSGAVVGISLPIQETQEMQVQSLCQEDPLEKEMATHSSIPAWKIPWTEKPGRLWSRKGSDTTERRHTHRPRQAHCCVHVCPSYTS